MKFYSAAAAALLLFAIDARAQPTAFTYQGQLNSSNAPANGLYDFQFQIFNASSNVVAGPLTNAPVGVTNGLFTTTLDFGGSVFDGSALWLGIGVRAYGNTNAYTELSPLQQITSTPYAIRALNAANAVSLSSPLQGTNIAGTISAANLPSNVAFLNSNQTFTASDTFSGAVTANNPANVFAGAFSGNGIGQTNLAATNLVGTIPDARLSTNVPLLNISNNFLGSVTAALFTGSGHGLTNVPGAFFWVTVSSTSVPAQPNVGYICTNNVTPVTVTLPSSPSVGDTYKVAGIGGAGWIIGQNANQTIFSGNLSDSIGQSWETNGPVANWSAIASSSDGTHLAATVNGSYIYTSTNSGTTWTEQNGNGNASGSWSSIASSADGTKLVATVGYTIYNTSAAGQIYTSANSGATWTARDSSRQWSSVASSADGTKLVAANYNNVYGAGNYGIYTSVNSGANWTWQLSGQFFSAVASSADGTKLVATIYGGQIYTSTNSGANWTARATSRNWTSVTSSSDGTRLAATVSGDEIYISTDSGATWTPSTPLITAAWTSVASSADGSRLAATTGGNSSSSPGNIYSSQDSGSTWTQLSGAPSLSWSDIASSADGSLLAAAVYGGDIYVSSQSSTTTGGAGYLSGAQHSTIELIYTGNGIFLPLNHEGTIRAY
jgi:hypothetical protein